MAKSIGIDLGSSKSCIGAWIKDELKIIENKQGNPTTPSYVSYYKKVLVGDDAKEQAMMTPSNTVFNTKRLIGFDIDKQYYPYKITKEFGKILIQMNEKGFTPEQITSMLLDNFMETAEAYLRNKIEYAVIVVPACYNRSQRLTIYNAAANVGLNVLRFVTESTVVCMTLTKEIKNEKVLIFSMGGGFINVSISVIKDGIIEVLSTSGCALGGQDFDNKLVNYLINEFKNKFNKDLTNNAKSLMLLRFAAIQAKHALSTNLEASVDISDLYDGIAFSTTISRSKFEEICSDLFNLILEPVKKAIKNFNKNKLVVVVIGGSTFIPKIKSLLENYFLGQTLSYRSSELVMQGATILSGILRGSKSVILQDILLLDVTALSLGIETAEGVMTTTIPYNTTIPTKSSKIFTTYQDNQTTIVIQIYEGDESMTKHNLYLDTYIVTGIPVLPRGAAKFEITFGLDANSFLDVNVLCTVSNKNTNVNMVKDTGRLSRKINEMLIIADN